MRAGMGNLLETDSDVASVSDNERERTDGDGMDSDALLDTNASVSLEPSSSSDNMEKGQSQSPDKSSTTVAGSVNDASNGNISAPLPSTSASLTPSTTKTLASSPRELPPRSQLIQLKPTMSKPKVNTRNSMESVTDVVNKQKNPRFIPYEPYRGAVRPIVAQDTSPNKHSRTASDASISSMGLEQAMGILSVNESKSVLEQQSLGIGAKRNTHESPSDLRKSEGNKNVDLELKKQEQTIGKQIHALTLLKERLKIAEKDNNDLHKENIRLKKLLVDSLSGDIITGRSELVEVTARNLSANESVDALSNEIEVWRSKFLSSCVLVEQLTRENSALHDAVGAAANTFMEIKLNSSLSPENFEEVNAWLRLNRGSSPAVSNNGENVL